LSAKSLADVTPAPRISVVTPTANRRALLKETMDTVACQTLLDWEHLVVDDGSDDGTEEEVAARSAADPRIRYFKRPADLPAGANVCRNLGLKESRAELVVFLDSDDLLRPDSLARRVALMAANPALNFAVFPAGVFTSTPGDRPELYHLQTPGDDLLRFLSLECVWQTTGPVWRRTYLEKLGGFDEALPSMQDVDLHVRALAARACYAFDRTPDHDIRGHAGEEKTSIRHFRDPAFIRAAGTTGFKLFDVVERAGLMNGVAAAPSRAGLRRGPVAGARRAARRGKGVADMFIDLLSEEAFEILSDFARARGTRDVMAEFGGRSVSSVALRSLSAARRGLGTAPSTQLICRCR